LKSLVAKKVGQEFMLYDPEKDCVHVLNPTAYRIHQLLGEAPDHPVMADVQEGIHSLERLGLA
jgi:hypothetical protein